MKRNNLQSKPETFISKGPLRTGSLSDILATRSMRAYPLAWQYTPIAYIPSFRQGVCRQVMVREKVFHELRDAHKG